MELSDSGASLLFLTQRSNFLQIPLRIGLHSTRFTHVFDRYPRYLESLPSL